MNITIAIAPCCWGVNDAHDPNQPPWPSVLRDAAAAGYGGIELGPYGYLPLDVVLMCEAIAFHGLPVVAGTICDDLVSPANLNNLLRQTADICSFISRLPQPERLPGQRYSTPYLTIMDHGRDSVAGLSDRAPCLSDQAWSGMVGNIRAIADLARDRYGLRTVIHPHAGGYIATEDEIARVDADVSVETAGLCLDMGHLYFSGINPEEALSKYSYRLDYLIFADVDLAVFARAVSEGISFSRACAMGLMCPIGQGVVDYTAIHGLLERMKYAGFIGVEQERNPQNANGSLSDVRSSLDYLKSNGF